MRPYSNKFNNLSAVFGAHYKIS